MKRSVPLNPLTVITMIFALIGLGLRFWLNFSLDEKGLIPPWHLGEILLYVLTAIFFLLLLVSLKAIDTEKCHLRIRFGNTRKIGAITCALGIGASSVLALLKLPQGLAMIVAIGGILIAFGLLFFGFRLDNRMSFPLLSCLTVYFMLYAVSQAQHWGTVAQVQHYVFPLLAMVFLTLTGYHRAELAVRPARCRWYVFFNHGALFFCGLSLCEMNCLFYLGAACWLVCDFTSAKFSKED